jgi:integrase
MTARKKQFRVLMGAFSSGHAKTLEKSDIFGVSGVMVSSKSKVSHKKCKNGGFQVGEGPFAVKVYKRGTAKGYVLYFKHGSQERRESRRLKAEALSRAQEVHKMLKAGVPSLAALSQAEIVDLLHARRELSRRGLPTIATAIQEYIAACELLPDGTSLIECVRYFTSRTPAIKSINLGAAISSYLADRQGSISERFYIQERQRLTKFADCVHCDISDLSAEALRAFLKTIQGGASKTQNNYRASLKSFLKWCVRLNYIERDHFLNDELESIRSSDAKGPSPYTPDEVRRILESAPPELVPIIVLQAFGGLRRAEALRLTWGDIFKIKGYIEVAGHKAKTRQRRLIPRSEILTQWLGDGIGNRSGDVCQFSDYALNDRMRAALKASEVKPKHNGFRDAFITFRMAQTGGDAVKVSSEAGNSPQMIFQHYRELSTPEQAEDFFSIRPKPLTTK